MIKGTRRENWLNSEEAQAMTQEQRAERAALQHEPIARMASLGGLAHDFLVFAQRFRDDELQSDPSAAWLKHTAAMLANAIMVAQDRIEMLEVELAEAKALARTSEVDWVLASADRYISRGLRPSATATEAIDRLVLAVNAWRESAAYNTREVSK